MTYELGIIGAGNMAEAIVRGVTAQGVIAPAQIIAADVSSQRRDFFRDQLGVTVVESNTDVARQSSNLLLSVKPQQMQSALSGIGAVLDPAARVISIMAGIGSAYIEKHLGGDKPWHVIRTMPNTPMLVGAGMVAISAGKHATTEDLAAARRIFQAAATVVEVSEDKIDAVTAVSGSGPAYFFYFLEHMIRAGTDLGLTGDQARLLAVTTASGAAKMLATTSESPEELRRKVTSPGGTTQAAIAHLEQNKAGEIFAAAIAAAARRSKELGI